MNKIIIFLYSVFLLFFSLFSYLFIDPNLSYLKSIYSGFAFSNTFLTTVLYILFVLNFFIFYGIFVWLGTKKKLQPKNIIVLLGITIGILSMSYPAMLSYDIFNYVATSKVLFFYHENPYIVMPIEFTGDSLLSFTHAANKIALYGPFWIMLTGIPYFLGINNFIITLFAFKLFIAVFYLSTIYLIWKISKNIIPVLLFAFNPLIVIETLISGHNDIVMMFLVLFSLLLLMRKKILLAGIFFILSILIKYTTILLIPIFLYILWKIFRKDMINWRLVFYFSTLTMLVGLLLSPIREEIYPWYAIWFLSFTFLASNKKLLLYISLIFSFSLLFRYVPFMLLGTHAGLTPIIKTIVTFAPVCLVLLWQRIFSR